MRKRIRQPHEVASSLLEGPVGMAAKTMNGNDALPGSFKLERMEQYGCTTMPDEDLLNIGFQRIIAMT